MSRAKPSPESEARRIAALRAAMKGRVVTGDERSARAQAARTAWARRKANGTASVQTSPEVKAKRAAIIRAVMADPVLNAKRQARSTERLNEVKKTPEFRAAVSAGLKRAYAADPEFARASIDRISTIHQVPEYREKNLAAVRAAAKKPEVRAKLRARANEPKNRIKREVARQRALEKKRGFKIPAHLWPAYKRLTQTKGFSMRAAGLQLGLIKS